MFASQFSEIMSTVLNLSKKHDMEINTPRVGTTQVDKIIVHMLKDLDKRLDEANARLSAAQEQIKMLNSAPAASGEVRSGEL
jgi:uncharacterized protein YPO0396